MADLRRLDAEPGTSGLFSPIQIGHVEVRNRTVLPAMTTRLSDAEGYVTEDTLAYYRARAEGGVGLVTVHRAAPGGARPRLRGATCVGGPSPDPNRGHGLWEHRVPRRCGPSGGSRRDTWPERMA